MVGTMGASVGHAISRSGIEQPTMSQTFRTAVKDDAMVRPVVIKKSQGWDI